MKNFYIFFTAFLISGLGFGQDSDSSVSAPTTQIAGGTITSLADTPGEAVDVFSFDITDSGDDDALPTLVTRIRLKRGPSSGSLDLSQIIEGITLDNASGTISSVDITPTTIDINFDTVPLEILNGTTETLTVGVYFKTTGDLVDGGNVSFFIDASSNNSGFTADTSGSTFSTTFLSNVVSNNFEIDVVFTKLSFLEEPTDVTVGQIMNPTVVVAYTDENENVDVDAEGIVSTPFGPQVYGISLTSSESGIFPGSTTLIDTENGVAVFNDLIFLTEANSNFLSAFDRSLTLGFFTPYNSNTFNVTAIINQTTYTYNNGWDTNPNGVSTSTDKILVESGNALIDQNTIIYDVEVEPGAALTINPGVTFRVVDRLLLDSQSNSYSSLIYNGVPTDNFTNLGAGTVVGGQLIYNRFVNSQANGNDLIAPPFENQSWSNFLSLGTNATDLFNDGNTGPTTYLFGPFSQSAESYILWTDDLDRDLGPGTGYRAATYDDTAASGSGTTLTFSGNLRTTPVELSLLFNAGTLFADWNLIGNPYTAHVNLNTLLDYDIDANTKNIDLIAVGAGIYAYDGDASDGWDIITLDNASSRLLTPGQGFLLPAAVSATTILSDKFTFDPSMRISGNSDDFISGRNAALTFLKMKAYTATKSYNTQFYFNETSSLGIDHGYDGKILGATPSFALYSNAVMDETQLPLGLQSLNLSALENTTIPLGVKSNAGEQITFSITESTLPASVEVYLEDTVTNTFTLLNTGDYTITPTTNLNGTGRFYLRLGDTALSTTDTTLDALQIYTDYKAGNLVISGNLTEATSAKVYDIEGRLVNTTQLTATSQTQTIDMSNLSAGVYVVQLANRTQSKTQKVIWR